MLYKRGSKWWYEFSVRGQRVRESAHTASRKTAAEVEKKRRAEVERGANGLASASGPQRIGEMLTTWLSGKGGHWHQDLTIRARHIDVEFGRQYPAQITASQIAAYQQRRLGEGMAERTINIEVACLRQTLRAAGQWERLAAHVRHMREASDVGRAVSPDDEQRLLGACRESHSPSLYPAVVLSLDSGLRRGELRRLVVGDFRLQWDGPTLVAGELVVHRAKTAAGEGRTVPLSDRVCAVLAQWFQRFPGAKPTDYLFPSYRVGGGKQVTRLWDLDRSRPMLSFVTAWKRAQRIAGTNYRWHDLRHTFVTRLLENPDVSEMVVRSLAGHVSGKMLERYSHIRMESKRQAIQSLGGKTSTNKFAHSAGEVKHSAGAK